MIATLALPFLWALCAPQTPPVHPPALTPLPPADLQCDGWLGERIAANRTAWLDRVDLQARLEPFQHRPAKQAWAGEHLGKWLHAGSLAFAQSGDPVLRERLAGAVSALLATQEADGYLGAYLPAQRFQLLPDADWDVWTVKYCLLGLLEYHARTGDERALAACRRAADQLLEVFGPGKRSILGAGTHVGMAATSVLGPIVQLYGATGDARYLAFARALVAAWDEPGGPRLAAALREHGRVARTANGKAYEMLSNLVGLAQLAAATGEPALLEPVRAAWRDIVANELQPTGSMSAHEVFTGGGRLPAGPQANLAETCVTVTWLQLNLELLRQTGDAACGREIERLACNHLAAAQRPDGAAWCYYTPLQGTKPYDAGITCCSSSGPRGMALLPQTMVLVGADGALCLDQLLPTHGTATLAGHRVAFTVQSGLPRTGDVQVAFDGDLPATFAVRVRLSPWALPAALHVGDEAREVAEPGWCTIPSRAWRRGDSIRLALQCGLREVTDAHDPQRVALQWGPCVLAAEGADATARPRLRDAAPRGALHAGKALAVDCTLDVAGRERTVVLRPFADAGDHGEPFRVWFGAPAAADAVPIADEARSRPGNVAGAIADGDRDTFVVTFDGRPAAEDWYAVTLAQPTPVRAVTFAHGHCFHDGGWFDASRGRPRVEFRAAADAEWQRLGELADYPATTATDARGLRDAAAFTLVLPAPVTAVAVRVVGAPAHGDHAAQAFSSCAELSAAR